MFVKVTNGQVDQYPYTVGDLRRDNPNTSFSKKISEAVMASYGMFPVGYQAAPAYDPMTQRLQHSSQPEVVDGKWVLTKTVVALTPEQIAERALSKSKEIRSERDELLAGTDWMALSDNNLTPEWAAYRQALRDITNHVNFPYLTRADWPAEPR